MINYEWVGASQPWTLRWVANWPIAFDRFVAKHCITSHQARWLSKDRLEDLIKPYPNLTLTNYKVVEICWEFESEAQMAWFFKGLHAYNLEPQVVLQDLPNRTRISETG